MHVRRLTLQSKQHGCGHDDDVAKDQPGDDHLKHILSISGDTSMSCQVPRGNHGQG